MIKQVLTLKNDLFELADYDVQTNKNGENLKPGFSYLWSINLTKEFKFKSKECIYEW